MPLRFTAVFIQLRIIDFLRRDKDYQIIKWKRRICTQCEACSNKTIHARRSTALSVLQAAQLAHQG